MDHQLATVEGFTGRFAADIRVYFNWRRFASERWPIEPVAVRSFDQLAAIEAPMCVGPDGRTCGLDDAGARRATVGEIPDLIDQLGGSGDFIRQEAERYGEAGVWRSQRPGYGLRAGAILMDGVHHSTAALLAEASIELDLYVVRGPLDPDCLADLRI